MNRLRVFKVVVTSVVLGMILGQWTSASAAQTDGAMLKHYTGMLDQLRGELRAKIPAKGASSSAVNKFLSSDALDAKLVKFDVLYRATPAGLAAFASKGAAEKSLVDQLLSNPALMEQMLVADGAKAKRVGAHGHGPAKYGPAMKIYTEIEKASDKAKSGVLQRLALAVALVHAVPIKQVNPKADENAPKIVDPVKRYLQYQKAYLNGQLDPAFKYMTTWDLKFVVDGAEPDWMLGWGRKMLQNYRPDHIYESNYGWRYVSMVRTDIRYGSGDVKYDLPELQEYQNILKDGGVCGRRAFFGRFILRAFGIPTTARPQRGHASLVHWTPKGWVDNLGAPWGHGWTKTRYKSDLDFLATTQARAEPKQFLRVKRAQWAGDVMGETPFYGEHQKGTPGFWYGVSLKAQRVIIKKSGAVTLAALGTDIGEANIPTDAQKIIASPVTPADRKISYGDDGVITIPAAAYSKPSGNTHEVFAMKSFAGGLQICLPSFARKGLTIMRGGTWKAGADACTSGARLKSGGYGHYSDWGLRAAMTATGDNPPAEKTLDLGHGVRMDMVYIKPGSFVMGGTSTKDGRFQCVEVPKHKVTLTKGYYLGKYEVTQAQFKAVTGWTPSRSTKGPNYPVDDVSAPDARSFCKILSKKTGDDVRLPTEAEWEYAARAGASTRWFFGSDPSQLGAYAWYKGNSGGKTHPVGQKKPNPWGLYDMYGNVCERVSDTYARDYYAHSPKLNPTGPVQKSHSHFAYQVNAPQAGKYALTAMVVTNNYHQKLDVAANDSASEQIMEMPFTCGKWEASKPVMLTLKQGENTLQFFRNHPPQYGMAVKSFTLKPVR